MLVYIIWQLVVYFIIIIGNDIQVYPFSKIKDLIKAHKNDSNYLNLIILYLDNKAGLDEYDKEIRDHNVLDTILQLFDSYNKSNTVYNSLINLMKDYSANRIFIILY